MKVQVAAASGVSPEGLGYVEGRCSQNALATGALAGMHRLHLLFFIQLGLGEAWDNCKVRLLSKKCIIEATFPLP